MYILIAYLLGILTAVKRIDPVNKTNQTQNESNESAPVLRPEPHIPKAIETKTEAKRRKNNALDIYMAFIHTLTMLAVVWYAIINSHMLDKMKESTGTAKEAMVRSQRPWVGAIRVIAREPFQITNKQVNMPILIFQFKNYGTSPALRINMATQPYFDAAPIFDPFNDQGIWTDIPPEKVSECRNAASAFSRPDQLGKVIFPGETKEIESGLFTTYPSLEALSNGLRIHGCIAYRDQFGQEIRYTRFCFRTPGSVKSYTLKQPLVECGLGQAAN
jgi:hypothetical protein